MATQHTSIESVSGPSTRRHFIVAICGLALIGAVALGLGTWRASDRANQSSAPGTASVATDAATEAEAVLPVQPTSGRAYLYIVASEEQAALVRQWSATADAGRAQAGGQPASVGIMVAGELDRAVIAEMTRVPDLVAYDLRWKGSGGSGSGRDTILDIPHFRP